MTDVKRINWRKSSYTGQEGGTCVELAALPPAVGVRDSKDPDGPILQFPTNVMTELFSQIKTGHLDL